MTLKHSDLFPAETEIMCKYFTGVKDPRYGDLQTVRPAPLWDGLAGKYETRSENGFINIFFADAFLTGSIAALAKGRLPVIAEPGDTGPAYRVYVFSNYVHEIWGAAQCTDAQRPPDFEGSGLRRLFAMAFFLAELAKENPPDGGFLKLFDCFSQDLDAFLAGGTLRGALPAAKCLTAAALRLRAFPAA